MIKTNQPEILKTAADLFPQSKIQGDILVIREEGKNIIETEREFLEKIEKV